MNLIHTNHCEFIQLEYISLCDFCSKKKIKIYLVGALDARSAFYQQFRIGDDRDDYLYIGVILQKKK